MKEKKNIERRSESYIRSNDEFRVTIQKKNNSKMKWKEKMEEIQEKQ